MPRGTYEKKVAVTSMSKDELKEVEEKNGNKISPFTKADLGIKAKPGEVVPGTHRVRVGNFTKPALVGHAGTLRDFAKIEIDHEAEGWIPMTWDQMAQYQEEGILVGWDADKMLGLLQDKPKRGKK